MKKIILSVFAMMAFAFTNAQETKFGIKGGFNLSNFSGDTEGVNFKARPGFNIGGFVEFKLTDQFAIQPEILYSTAGAKAVDFEVSDGGMLLNGDVAFNFSYINIPVMFKYYVAEKFNIEAGPQVGFLTSAKTKTTVDGFSGSDEQDVKDLFESVDFGLNLGAGYDFTDNFSAGLRYNLGLANIANTEEGDDTKLHNGVFSLSVGYKF